MKTKIAVLFILLVPCGFSQNEMTLEGLNESFSDFFKASTSVEQEFAMERHAILLTNLVHELVGNYENGTLSGDNAAQYLANRLLQQAKMLQKRQRFDVALRLYEASAILHYGTPSDFDNRHVKLGILYDMGAEGQVVAEFKQSLRDFGKFRQSRELTQEVVEYIIFAARYLPAAHKRQDFVVQLEKIMEKSQSYGFYNPALELTFNLHQKLQNSGIKGNWSPERTDDFEKALYDEREKNKPIGLMLTQQDLEQFKSNWEDYYKAYL